MMCLTICDLSQFESVHITGSYTFYYAICYLMICIPRYCYEIASVVPVLQLNIYLKIAWTISINDKIDVRITSMYIVSVCNSDCGLPRI